MLAFACDSYLLCSSLPFIFFLFHRVQYFPHLANLTSDFRYSVARELILYYRVNIHAREEESAHSFLNFCSDILNHHYI
jgi:hypothetical protein